MRTPVRAALFAAAVGASVAGCNAGSAPPPPPVATAATAAETAPMPKSVPTARSADNTAPDKTAPAAGKTPPDKTTAAAGKVELLDVTFAGLDEAVKKNTGKVVLVDVWATFCPPCVKKFPHLVELHEKHAKDGLVLITVTIDEKHDRDKALKFLQDKHATGTNFFLTETDEATTKKWHEKYPVLSLPVLAIQNRKGERVVTDEGDLTPAKLDEMVEKLLAEK